MNVTEAEGSNAAWVASDGRAQESSLGLLLQGRSLGICLQGWHQPVGLGFLIGNCDVAKLSVQREKTVLLKITVRPFRWGELLIMTYKSI